MITRSVNMLYDFHLDFLLFGLDLETTKLWRYVKTGGKCYDYPIYEEMKEYNLCKEEWDGEIADFCYYHEELNEQQEYHLHDMYRCRNRAWSLYECGDSY